MGLCLHVSSASISVFLNLHEDGYGTHAYPWGGGRVFVFFLSFMKHLKVLVSYECETGKVRKRQRIALLESREQDTGSAQIPT